MGIQGLCWGSSVRNTLHSLRHRIDSQNQMHSATCGGTVPACALVRDVSKLIVHASCSSQTCMYL
jgi:hypothetical protein